MRSLATLLGLVVTASQASAQPLALDDVLASARSHHPSLAAARTAIDRAEGQLLAAEGAFDPRIRARATDVVAGYYDHVTVDTEARALTPVFGLTPFVGWRVGRGLFPLYDDKLRTLEGGEMRAGLELPVLQGFAIDRARAERAKARIARRVAAADVDQRMLDVMRDATLAYWDWVAASHRVEVRRTQLALAIERGRQIEQGVARGSRAPIEIADNGRVIVSREALVVAAERDLRRASLELSLHLRAPDGTPSIPSADMRPELGELPAPLPLELDVSAAIARGLARAPRVRELQARAAIAKTDVALARNQMLPRLDVVAQGARGIGPADPTLPDRSEIAFAIGATFEIPLGMRGARGAVAMARADERRIMTERQLAAERIAVEVRGAHADLVAARARSELASRNADLAEQLARAERSRFDRGDSNVLLVNIREEAAAEAAAQAIDARTDVMRARGRFATLLGEEPR